METRHIFALLLPLGWLVIRLFIAVSAGNWLVGANCIWAGTRGSLPPAFQRQNCCVGKYSTSVTGIL